MGCPYPVRDWMSTKSLWLFKGVKRMQVDWENERRACTMVSLSLWAWKKKDFQFWRFVDLILSFSVIIKLYEYYSPQQPLLLLLVLYCKYYRCNYRCYYYYAISINATTSNILLLLLCCYCRVLFSASYELRVTNICIYCAYNIGELWAFYEFNHFIIIKIKIKALPSKRDWFLRLTVLVGDAIWYIDLAICGFRPQASSLCAWISILETFWHCYVSKHY